MLKFLSLIFVAFFAQGAVSQFLYEGGCPIITALESWQLSKFVGEWKGYGKAADQVGLIEASQCIFAVYTDLGNNSVKIAGTGINPETQAVVSYQFDGTVVAPGVITFPPEQTLKGLTVIDTDYDHFATLYNCVAVTDVLYQINVYVITRDLPLVEPYLGSALKALELLNLNNTTLQLYDQEGCFA